jgi:glycyl-tRNA synthetase beta chain
MPAFLLEIGLEEIPAGMITAAQAELAQRFDKLLTRERLASDDLRLQSFSTPRRLAVLIDGLLPRQADLEEEVVGPSMKVAYKDGMPTPAAIAFAKKSGVEVEALKTVQNAKGEYVAATIRRQGRSAAEVLTDLAPAEIAGIYWPKNMHWRAGKPERFVRPVRWLLALLDEEILPLQFAGVTAASVSYGHRILHGDAPVVIRRPKEYAEKLVAAFVQVDPEVRKHRIRKALDAATRQVPGARWREDEALVDTVTNLTEWPNVILGSFDPLRLPKEVLITVMRDHQKYFALEDANGNLLPHFLAVLNIEADAAGAAIIRHGNERVLRARFNDAQFFWDVDQKIPLVNRVEMLKHVTFHKDLGNYWNKKQRVVFLVKSLADEVIQNGTSVEARGLETAAELAKTDLTSELVKEFTELQGTVGGRYAAEQGLGEIVAHAICDQYKPRSLDDSIPNAIEGQLLAIADKADTITGMFGMGYQPTGSKDPFALRRAANGIVKILAETGLPLSHTKIFSLAAQGFEHLSDEPAFFRFRQVNQNVGPQIFEFIQERIQFYMINMCGFSYDSVDAVLGAAPYTESDNVSDIIARTRDIELMRESEDFLAVCGTFKRIENLLSQARLKGDTPGGTVELKELREDAEKRLWQEARALSPVVEGLRRQHRYREALENIATLRSAVDIFFEQVMVMVPEDNPRLNRLALLQFVRNEFSTIADFSQVVVQSPA